MPRQGWRISFRSDDERQMRREAGEDGSQPCARGAFCSMGTRERGEDGRMTRVPARTSRAFCDRDAIIIGSCLRGFPPGHALLGRMLGEHVTREVMVRVPFGPAVPVRVDLDELARAMVDAAMTWLERVAGVDSTLTPPDTSRWRERSLGPRPGVLLDYAVPRLAERVSALTALEPGPMVRPSLAVSLGCGTPIGPCGDTVLLEASGLDAGSEVLALGYLWRAALGLTPAPRDDLLGVDCPGCGRRSLRRSLPPLHEGDRAYYAECADCGELVTDQEFREHTARMVRFYRRRVTPAILASAGLRGDESPAISACLAPSAA